MKILHAADLHLDSPFHALDRERAAQRRAEQRSLLLRIADIALKQSADIAVFAGDLFDSDDPFTETGLLLAQALSSLPMPVFIAPGNHDWFGPRSAWTKLRFGPNVHLFSDSDIKCVELPAFGARIWGTAFTGRSRPAPLVGFEAEKDGDTVDIMVLHGEVGVPGSPYGAVSEQDLARSGMDYVALGHIHTYSGLKQAGNTYYAWPGCPEGRGFDEPGVKGIVMAEVAPGSCRLEFIPVEGRRYEIVEVDITDSENLIDTVAAAVGDGTGNDIYRVRLTGETAYPPDVLALRRALENRFYGLELRDETRPRRELWAGAGTDSLRGLFLTQLYEKYQASANETEKERIAQAARWGIRAMENGEELPL